MEKELYMYIDVMHVDSKKFFVTMSDPLNLTLQCWDDTAEAIGIAENPKVCANSCIY